MDNALSKWGQIFRLVGAWPLRWTILSKGGQIFGLVGAKQRGQCWVKFLIGWCSAERTMLGDEPLQMGW
jgi:hypothetical protein